MKIFLTILVFCIGYLQYALHLDARGSPELRRITTYLEEENLKKKALIEKNRELVREIHDLSSGYEVIEELARYKMGMIGKGETFLRVYPKEKETMELRD